LRVETISAHKKFLRYEFKYILPNPVREKIEKEFNYFMKLDPFVRDLDDKKYFVRSLYFENANYSAYYDKLDGLLNRTKFRIRTYSDTPDQSRSYLERKGRFNNFVTKERVPLSGSVLTCLLNPYDLKDINSEELGENPILHQFVFDVFRKKVKPCILVDYWRRPYISIYSYEFRVTFDDTLRTIRSASLFPKRACPLRNVLKGATIMEIKFAKHIPVWFHKIIKNYQLGRLSVSKFCICMEKHYPVNPFN